MSQNLLAEARAAYHELVTGNKAVSLVRAGKSVTFQPTEIHRLKSYITELESAENTQQGRRCIGVCISV